MLRNRLTLDKRGGMVYAWSMATAKGLSVSFAETPAKPQTPKQPEQKANFVEVVFRHYIFERSEEKTLRHIVSKVLPKIDIRWEMPDGKRRIFTAKAPPNIHDIREVTSKISTTYHEDFVQAKSEMRERLTDIPFTERAERIHALAKEVAAIEQNIELLQDKVRAAIPKDNRTPTQARAYEGDTRALNTQLGLKRDFIAMLEKIMGPLEEDVPLDVTHDNAHDIALAVMKSIEKWIDGNLLPPILVSNAGEILEKWRTDSASNRS